MSDRGSIELPFLMIVGVASTVVAVVNWLDLVDSGSERIVAWAAALAIGVRVWQRFLKPLAMIPGRLTRIEKHLGIEDHP